jgi:hypothetical protein
VLRPGRVLHRPPRSFDGSPKAVGSSGVVSWSWHMESKVAWFGEQNWSTTPDLPRGRVLPDAAGTAIDHIHVSLGVQCHTLGAHKSPNGGNAVRVVDGERLTAGGEFLDAVVARIAPACLLWIPIGLATVHWPRTSECGYSGCRPPRRCLIHPACSSWSCPCWPACRPSSGYHASRKVSVYRGGASDSQALASLRAVRRQYR